MKKISVLIFGLIVLSLFVFSEYSDLTEYEAKYYENAKVIRVKYTQGETYVKRSYEEGFEEAAINLPVFEKDTVGTTEGRLELYLGRLNYLRLDYDTEIEFVKVPALRTTGMTIRIKRGGIYLDIENLDYEKDVEVQTPDCGVFLLDKGLYRVNVNEGGKTEVYVYDGTAEVAGDDYSRNLRANQKVVMLNGRVRERPFYFYSSDQDEFDSWNELRNQEVGYARYGSSRYLEEGYEDYEYELSRSGRWKYNDTYRTHIWIPYNVGGSWSPYYHGRWVWNPFYGYVWHSYDPWGWYTHYYGRWHWSYYDGWGWVPGYRWSPAWVSWGWHGNYYGWCPLSRYNRPIVVINKRWLRNHNFKRGIPTNASSLVVIKKNQLSSSNIHKVALKKGALSAKNLTFRGNAPGEKPVSSMISVVNARGKSVVYKKNGLVSRNKYKTISSTSGTLSTKGTVYKYTGEKGKQGNPYKYSNPRVKAKIRQPGTSGATVTKKIGYKSSESVTKKTYYPGSTVIKKKVYKSGRTSGSKIKTGTVSKKYSTSKPGSTSGSKVSKKVYKKSGSKSSSSGSSSKGTSKKVKKKKDSPYFSSKSYSSSTNSTSYSGSTYASSGKKTYKSYYSSSSKPRRTYSSTYKSRSYSSKKSYKPSSSYQNYSRQGRRSSSYKRSSSYSKSSSSRSYSRPSSSVRSSSVRRSSSSRSSSSRSSSVRRSSSSRSSSSRSSSSRSVRKK